MSLWLGVPALILAFLLLYQPWRLAERELYRAEGGYAVQAQEMDWSLPMAQAHGVALRNEYPLYPLAASLLRSVTDWPMESVLRLLAVAATAATALMVGFAAGRARDGRAALVAAAMYLSCEVVVEKSLDGYPITIAVFFLLAAQLSFYYFAIFRSAWNRAWMISGALLAAAFYTGGFWYVFCFVFPLLFMRRPLTVGNRWLRPGMAIGAALLAVAILLWLLPYLNSTQPGSMAWESRFAADGVGGYLWQLVQFPWDLAVRLLPWTLLAWSPFCVALFKVDATPLFSQYLRTIAISTLFLLWLRPGFEPRDLLIAVGPLAVMTGINYEMTVRRYAVQLDRVLLGCEWFLWGVAALLTGFMIVPEPLIALVVRLSHPIDFRFGAGWVAATLGMAVCVALLAWSFRLRRGQGRRTWLLLLTTATGGALFYWQAMYPYRSEDIPKRTLGGEFRTALASGGAPAERANLPVFKLNIQDLYGEIYYMGVRVRKIDSLTELPREDRTVYLFSTEFPQYPERVWTNLLPPGKTYRGHSIALWKGVRRETEP